MRSVLNKIPKRIAFIASTVIYFSLALFYILAFPTGFNLKLTFWFILISALVFLVTCLFITFSLKTIIKIAAVPVVYVTASFLVLNFFPNLNTLFKLAYVFFSTFLYYYLLLSINVFLVVHEKGSVIPLVRPAKTAFLLIEVVTLFLFFTAVYKILLVDPFTEITFVFQTLIIGVVSFLFAEQYWWSQDLENEITSFVGNESIVIAFLCIMFSISLSFYDSEAFFRSLALTTCFYISINFFQSVVTHRFKSNQFIEYFLISIIVGFLFLLG
jgi:hypothetical protein